MSYQVTSEIAYDLLQDNVEVILRLLDRPMERDEVLSIVGSEKTLTRLVRHGLVAEEGSTLRAVADTYDQVRQEGMMTFLERYVLPNITASLEHRGHSTLQNRHVTLTESQIRGLYNDRVLPMFQQLAEISERTTDGVLTRLSVMFIGTTRIDATADMTDEDEALYYLKQASAQRATESERPLALLSQLDMLADNSRYLAAADTIEKFLNSFSSERASSAEEATYHFTVASHWRSATVYDEQYRGAEC